MMQQDTWTMRIVITWGMALVSIISYKVFFDPVDIAMGTATAYGTTMTALTAAAGLFQYIRDKISKQMQRKRDNVRD